MCAYLSLDSEPNGKLSDPSNTPSAIPGNIGVMRGDQRQDYLAKQLHAMSLPVLLIQEPEPAVFKTCSLIVAPTPLTKDKKTLTGHPALSIEDFHALLCPGQTLFGGNLPEQTREYCRQKKITFYDFMEMEEVAQRNAVATAEGAVCEAICASLINLDGSLCLVAGYGRCGQIIARKLRGMDADVTVMECDEKKQHLAKKEGFPCIQSHALAYFLETNSIQFLFNTIPCPIFHEGLLKRTPEDITIIDIASAPGGVDFAYCQTSGRKALLCPGLPGKYSPKTSGQVLCHALFLTDVLSMTNAFKEVLI